ncbi:acyloxyacyl hydrolase [Polaribacter sp. PL03]|uniref:acyloxyacyl hydrolase n=1 Tax=Polaribacter sp. PL03 TaxID=3088353 RepID=UPI0029D0A757|nr:acyloxyacyl hydrolase [Polaribacter sp. PL03]MDX6747547.1 acyloxyacyl hydrolase [Polaribacter sp. PL03]
MKKILTLFFIFLFSGTLYSQEEQKSKAQPSKFLSKSYYSINFGGIFYPFSNDNLIDGYKTDSYSKNYFSGRLLLGYKIVPDLAIQFGTLRPAAWFKYNNVNNIGYERSVWINAWSLSLKKNMNLNKKLSIYGEAGVANVTRIGFSINDDIIYPDAHFASLLYGFGFNYKLNKKWRLNLNGTFLPKSEKENQPSISQVTFGFEYHINKLSKEQVEKHENNGYFFPKNTIQVSYGNSKIGFGANKFFGMSLKVGNFESFGIPVFWVGEVKAAHAFSITYQRLAFRTEKIFSLDWGVSVTAFQTEATKENVLAFSIFPTMRFYILRRKGFDMYTNYSLIGPTYLTKANLDKLNTGPKITYQDTMGLGVFFGKKRAYNAELRIMHYSNGNIFPQNSGVAVPIQFTFGKTF